jgi:acyl dehydratase
MTTARTALNFADLPSAVGLKRGPGEWMTITQEQINLFADATHDHQWIHTDPERAASGPFGGTIAHGYLTLSLVPPILRELFPVTGYKHALNYGLNSCRFPAPTPVDSRVRGSLQVKDVSEVHNGFDVTLAVTIEIDLPSSKPVCVAEVRLRYLG